MIVFFFFFWCQEKPSVYIFGLIKCFFYSATRTASVMSTEMELPAQAYLYVSVPVSELNLVKTPCSIFKF